jgi:uncharacterized protein (DUF362 family)
MTQTSPRKVAVGFTEPVYNDQPPFHPGERYPELQFDDISSRPNLPYAVCRDLLQRLGFDNENYGTRLWNPFGEFIRPGDTVLIKPNFVRHYNETGDTIFSVITHPSIIRVAVDYAFKAMLGRGRIVIADAPQMDCIWAELMKHERLDAIQEYYQREFGFTIEVYDLRPFEVLISRKTAYPSNRKALPGDPAGSVVVDLGSQSKFFGMPNDNVYGADFDRQGTIARHHGDTQQYVVSKTVLSADVVISIPKMKTHKKVGVTLNLKNLVGITTDKNCLVHYRLGTPADGGDQIPDVERKTDLWPMKVRRWLSDKTLARQDRLGEFMYKAAKGFGRGALRALRRTTGLAFAPPPATQASDCGNWYGNDSAWRMVADLTIVFFFGDKNGGLNGRAGRRMFSIVDGVIAGQKDGPLDPEAVLRGCLVLGQSPIAVDLVTTRLMGFDFRKLRQFDIISDPRHHFGIRSVDEIEVLFREQVVPGAEWFADTYDLSQYALLPHPGWVGHAEI